MNRQQVRLDSSTPDRHSNVTGPPDPERVPRLPTLDAGLTLLESEGRAVGPLDSLVLDHLLRGAGDAVWVDTGGHATTRNLARLAPSLALLDRVRVARAFTAYQHGTLVRRACESFPPTASLVVVPWVDALYRDGDCSDREASAMIDGAAERLAALAAERDVAVLVTRRAADDLTAPVADRADAPITCRETRFGPRFAGDGFETLVYGDGEGRRPSDSWTRSGDGRWVQTTLAFWARVLERREAMHASTPAAGAV
jgi:hypothetical protein